MIRALPAITVISAPATAAISSMSASEVLPERPRKWTATVRVFCARKMISRIARRTAAHTLTHTMPARVGETCLAVLC